MHISTNVYIVTGTLSLGKNRPRWVFLASFQAEKLPTVEVLFGRRAPILSTARPLKVGLKTSPHLLNAAAAAAGKANQKSFQRTFQGLECPKFQTYLLASRRKRKITFVEGFLYCTHTLLFGPSTHLCIGEDYTYIPAKMMKRNLLLHRSLRTQYYYVRYCKMSGKTRDFFVFSPSKQQVKVNGRFPRSITTRKKERNK